MQTNIQEIYQKTILPLPDNEKLQIASLILEDVTGKREGEKRKPKPNGGIREMFGTWQDKKIAGEEHRKLDHNEQIDFDLAMAYEDNNEDAKSLNQIVQDNYINI